MQAQGLGVYIAAGRSCNFCSLISDVSRLHITVFKGMIGVYRFLTYVLQLSLYFNCGYASPVGVHNVSKRDDAVISAGNTTHSTPTNWGGKYDGDYVEVRLYGEKDGIGIDVLFICLRDAKIKFADHVIGIDQGTLAPD